MKKCPFCAEEIQDEAVKCKHCKNDLSFIEKNKKQKAQAKKMYKILGLVVLGIFAVMLWYLSIPIIAIWYIWKKTNWDKQKKYIGTALAVVLLFLLGGLYAHLNRDPKVVISEPANNFTIQASETTVKGKVDPKDAKLEVNGETIKTDNGSFSYLAKLGDEKNIFSFKTSNNNGQSEEQFIINRTFTETELAELKQRKADEEVKRQAALEAQKKADEEARVKQLAEQKAWEQSKAGKLCAKYKDWTKEECDSVADGKYWIGMTYDMLVESYGGKPNHANPSNYGGRTRWQWCWTYYTPSCFYDDNEDGVIDSYN